MDEKPFAITSRRLLSLLEALHSIFKRSAQIGQVLRSGTQHNRNFLDKIDSPAFCLAAKLRAEGRPGSDAPSIRDDHDRVDSPI